MEALHLVLCILLLHYGRRQEHVNAAARLQLQAQMLLAMGSLRERHYLTRPVLPKPQECPWACVLRSRNDMAFLEFTGLTWASFRYLWEHFDPVMLGIWSSRKKPGEKRGRKRTMRTIDVLGGCLMHLHMFIRYAGLCALLSQTPGTLSVYISEGLVVLLCVLKELPESRISWPSREEMEECASLISARQPHLPRSFAFVDGLNLAINDPSDPLEQNAYYNSWLSGCFCSSLFCFNPKGEIIWCYLNAPGSWHDSTMAQGLYKLLRERVPDGFSLISDSAFAATKDAECKIVKPLKQDQLEAVANDKTLSVKEIVGLLKKHRSALSVRQAAEWGMRTIQGAHGRLQAPLPANHKSRRLILDLVARLHNYRTRTVGLNQTRTVYSPDYVSTFVQRDRHTYYLSVREAVVV